MTRSGSARQLVVLLPLLLLPLGILILVDESAKAPEAQAILATQDDEGGLEVQRGLQTRKQSGSRKNAAIELETGAVIESEREMFVENHSTTHEEELTGFMQITADWLTSVKQGNLHLSLTASENGIQQRPGDRPLRFSHLVLSREFRVRVRSGNNLILEQVVRGPTQANEVVNLALEVPKTTVFLTGRVRDLQTNPIIGDTLQLTTSEGLEQSNTNVNGEQFFFCPMHTVGEDSRTQLWFAKDGELLAAPITSLDWGSNGRQSLGEVTLSPVEALATCIVVDEAGNPLPRARIQVQARIGNDQDHRWQETSSLRPRQDIDSGITEIRGLAIHEYFRVRATKLDGYRDSAWQEYRRGNGMVLLVMERDN